MPQSSATSSVGSTKRPQRIGDDMNRRHADAALDGPGDAETGAHPVSVYGEAAVVDAEA